MKIISKSENADGILSSLEMLSSGINAYEDVKNKNLTFSAFYECHQTMRAVLPLISKTSEEEMTDDE